MGFKNISLFDIYWCDKTNQGQDIINIAVKGYEFRT